MNSAQHWGISLTTARGLKQQAKAGSLVQAQELDVLLAVLRTHLGDMVAQRLVDARLPPVTRRAKVVRNVA